MKPATDDGAESATIPPRSPVQLLRTLCPARPPRPPARRAPRTASRPAASTTTRVQKTCDVLKDQRHRGAEDDDDVDGRQDQDDVGRPHQRDRRSGRPEKPASAPARAPSNRAPAAAVMDTPSDSRAPRTTRAKMSRPRASPPSSSQGPARLVDLRERARREPLDRHGVLAIFAESTFEPIRQPQGIHERTAPAAVGVDDARPHGRGVAEIGELAAGVVRGDERGARRHQRDRDEQRGAGVTSADLTRAPRPGDPRRPAPRPTAGSPRPGRRSRPRRSRPRDRGPCP